MRDFRILAKYARTVDKEDLPMRNFIRYPAGLLDWYGDPHYDTQLRFQDDQEKSRIQEFLEVVRIRDEERKNSVSPLTGFSDEFKAFHFDHLHSAPMVLGDLMG